MSPRRTHSIRAPGFLVRRLQQVAVAIFHERLLEFELTPIQYTILRILENEEGLDQVTVAVRAVLDASSVADVLRRLEGKGLVTRRIDAADKRKRLIFLTREGRQLLAASLQAVRRAQEDFLQPLSPDDEAYLLRMIEELLEFHEKRPDAAVAMPWRRVRNGTVRRRQSVAAI